MVAVSSEDYKMWLNGLQLVLHLGSINITRVRRITSTVVTIVPCCTYIHTGDECNPEHVGRDEAHSLITPSDLITHKPHSTCGLVSVIITIALCEN